MGKRRLLWPGSTLWNVNMGQGVGVSQAADNVRAEPGKITAALNSSKWKNYVG